MTLRDLTPRQLYNLRRRAEKERKEKEKLVRRSLDIDTWRLAYNMGLKVGLSFLDRPTFQHSDNLPLGF